MAPLVLSSRDIPRALRRHSRPPFLYGYVLDMYAHVCVYIHVYIHIHAPVQLCILRYLSRTGSVRVLPIRRIFRGRETRFPRCRRRRRRRCANSIAAKCDGIN